MELISRTARDDQSPFIELTEISGYYRAIGLGEFHQRHIDRLISLSLLPTFVSGTRTFVLKQDLISLIPVISISSLPSSADPIPGELFSDALALSKDCYLELSASERRLSPILCSAVRNLISFANQTSEFKRGAVATVSYFPPSRISTSSAEVAQFIIQQKTRAATANVSDASDFAGSAHYMGSKRLLSGFLVEALSSFVPSEGIVVDLMCGSGAASRAFSRLWTTFASDLQQFCGVLAVVQGAGFTLHRAEDVLKKVLPTAREHVKDLMKVLSNFISQEDKILHSDIGPRLLEDYRRFIKGFPTYPSEKRAEGWYPRGEVENRKIDHALYPYCLFSCYFANVYFGLRQCVEIDSLRYAIDQLKDNEERLWCLGALVTTASALGTTYAAHFAQPRFGDAEDLRIDNLAKVIEQRAYSIIHEFSVRLMNLAEEAGKAPRKIDLVPGPWRDALFNLDELLDQKSCVVYVDAPYKREEYSRYYHVLETLVLYSYPASIGKGRLPMKPSKERPTSEFFTRSQLNINGSFVNLISEILARQWICAWSYASSGDADIVSVIDQVTSRIDCEVKSYATPYEHKTQGKGKLAKRITEYLILISPK